MGKYLLRIILILFIWAYTSPSLRGQEKIIHVGADNAYFPFEYLDTDNKAAGFNIDLLKALAKETDLKLKITTDNWFIIKAQMEKGSFDMLAGMYYNLNRAELFDFTMPYIIITHSIFVKNGNSIRSFDEIKEDKSIRLVVENSSILHNYLTTNGIQPDRILTVENQLDALLIVDDSYTTCALLPELQAKYIAKKNGLDDIITVGLPILPREYAFAVTKGDTVLLKILNEGLTRLQLNGEFNRVFEHWFGNYHPTLSVLEDDISFSWLISIPIVSIFIFVLFFLLLRTKKLRNENNSLHRELKQSNQVLKDIHKSETLFKRIVEFSPFPIAMIHEEGYFIFTNSGFEELFGKQLNKNGSVSQWLKESVKNEHDQNFIKSQFFYNPIDLVSQSKSNSNFSFITKMDLEKSMQLFFVSLGNGQLLLFFFDNIEETKDDKQQELTVTEIDIKTPINLLPFVYDVRSPMNIIMGFSAMMKTENMTLKDMKSFASLIHQNSQMLSLLLVNIETLVKIDSDELRLRHEFILVSNLISNVHQHYIGLVPSKKYKYSLKIKCLDKMSANLVVNADQGLLNRILLNLLYYMQELAKNESLALGCKLIEKSNMQFFVESDLDDKVFQLFAQKIAIFYDGSNDRFLSFLSGVDLSLYISLSLIKVFGSKAELVRDKSNLARFVFSLPSYSSKDSVAQYKVKHVSKNKQQFDWEGKKILIADDNLMSSDYFQIIFKSTKANIAIAKDGQEAYEKCRRDPRIDLVIMDWLMPVMDGETSTKLIKQLRPELPIISITAFALGDERAKILQSGCNAYYPKPVDKNELLNYIQTLFEDDAGIEKG